MPELYPLWTAKGIKGGSTHAASLVVRYGVPMGPEDCSSWRCTCKQSENRARKKHVFASVCLRVMKGWGGVWGGAMHVVTGYFLLTETRKQLWSPRRAQFFSSGPTPGPIWPRATFVPQGLRSRRKVYTGPADAHAAGIGGDVGGAISCPTEHFWASSSSR